MADPTEGAHQATNPPRTGFGPLDLIEWIGNKLPDPAFLFLIGAVIVMIASHFAAPSLPDGFEVRFKHVGNGAGGVDEHVAYIARDEVVLDAAGAPVLDKDGNPETRELLATVDVTDTDADTPHAHLIVDETGEPVTDASGQPVNLADSGWAVFTKRPVAIENPVEGGPKQRLEPTGDVLLARSLLTSEGLYWCLSSMEHNFLGFAPLGVVLLGMLGIGVAEKTGLIGALLEMGMKNVPHFWLTPATVFLGVMSSLATDAGYVVLPPLAAAIYLAAGRSPLVGIAAVFAGVSAGFNANLLLTSLEPLMADLSTAAAQTVDPNRAVAATSNWYFLAASTVLITFIGWATTAFFVERRFNRKPADEGGPDHHAAQAAASAEGLTSRERTAAWWALAVFGLTCAVFTVLTFIPNSPLHGTDGPFPRWVAVIVPLMFFAFVLPGIVYGAIAGNTRTTKDVAKHMIGSMADMAPIIVLAFFAGQFVAYFGESNLGNMLAFSGGEWLFRQQLHPAALILAFIGVTMVFNLFVGSMSAKYTLFAPIFVPMFMLIGIRPELTQVAYRIGDSVTNIITPLNAYLVIILVYMRQYARHAGMGTLIAMMLPYTVVFALFWAAMLLGWMSLDIPLGPSDPMTPFSETYTEAATAATQIAP